jgi:hypothetical protein
MQEISGQESGIYLDIFKNYSESVLSNWDFVIASIIYQISNEE